ncbi:hypothetical protein PENTCL1PPCAC_15982, partial [Pristionchus entomophagus]
MEIYLSIETQEVLLRFQRGFFIITSFMNIISLFYLIKETPPNQAQIRAYLLFLQVLVIISSVYLDVFFVPIPLFPAIAGYCVGLLCTDAFPLNQLLGVFILILVLVGSSILSCSIYRHQTIIPASNPLRVSKISYNLTWIIDRGRFFAHEKTNFMQIVINMVIITLQNFQNFVILLFWHMLRVLRA